MNTTPTTGDRRQRRGTWPAIRPTECVEIEQFGAWQDWLSRLTPDEQVALEGLGLAAPEMPGPRKRPRGQEEDEDSPQVGTCDHMPSSSHTPYEALVAKEEEEAIARVEAEREVQPLRAFDIDESTRHDLALLGFVLPHIVDADNPRLTASIIALGLGIGARQGITVEGLAERHHQLTEEVLQRVESWMAKFKTCRVSLLLLKRVMSPILSSRNPRLETVSIAMAARFGLTGGASMTAVGEHHGVCKAAISTRVRDWVEEFGLPLPRECKQQTSNYVLSNVRREKPKVISAA